jgi:predicted Zn-dependent peptidase
MKDDLRDPETSVATLPNGVRVVAIELPHLETVSVAVFVRSGSQHESARLNGISHVVEHMAFKGTRERDCQQINLDAERLGADVNAHTDKDHTAFHMSGLGRDAGRFIAMLGDIVRNSTFPEVELERERQVILHEYLEDEDDALSTAYKLFDRNCFGDHPVAQPVIGNRRNIQRFARAELLDYVQRQYTGANTVVGIAGALDRGAVLHEAQAAFASMPPGTPNTVVAPDYVGGISSRRKTGCSQTHVVLGFPMASLRDDDPAGMVAAALFGEGMSSPLMDQIRERRGLAYYVACSAESLELCGQFYIEATTVPEHLDELFVEVTRLLRAHTERIDGVALERARNQIAVRMLRDRERPLRRLEDSAQDLFVHGRVRPRAEVMARIAAVDADAVRAAFAQMLQAPPAIAIAGKVPKGVNERVREIVEGRAAQPAARTRRGVPKRVHR